MERKKTGTSKFKVSRLIFGSFKVLFWVAVVLVTAFGLMGGIAALLQGRASGYPLWFLIIIGITTCLAAAALAFTLDENLRLRRIAGRRRRRDSAPNVDDVVFQPVTSLLAERAVADYDIFERRFTEVCKVVDDTYQSSELKWQKVNELMAIVNTQHSRYQDHVMLGLARLSRSYCWLPHQPVRLLQTIANTDDLGALGQILINMTRHGHDLAGIAILRYQHEYKRHRIARFDLVSRKIEKLVREAGDPTIIGLPHMGREKARKPDEYFDDYEEQINKAPA